MKWMMKVLVTLWVVAGILTSSMRAKSVVHVLRTMKRDMTSLRRFSGKHIAQNKSLIRA